jgi:hypothetical protein
MLLRAVFEDEGLIGWKAFQENRSLCEILKTDLMFCIAIQALYGRVFSATPGN